MRFVLCFHFINKTSTEMASHKHSRALCSAERPVCDVWPPPLRTPSPGSDSALPSPGGPVRRRRSRNPHRLYVMMSRLILELILFLKS